MARVSLVALALLAAARADERALEPAVTAAEQCELLDDAGPWSSLLQQWALTETSSARHGQLRNLLQLINKFMAMFGIGTKYRIENKNG